MPYEMTAIEFAEHSNINYVQAVNFLKVAELYSKVKVIGLRDPKTGKGKKSTIYSIPMQLTFDFSKPIVRKDEPDATKGGV